jgi:hypothetical protein
VNAVYEGVSNITLARAIRAKAWRILIKTAVGGTIFNIIAVAI